MSCPPTPIHAAPPKVERSFEWLQQAAGVRDWRQDPQRRFTHVSGAAFADRRIGRLHRDCGTLIGGLDWSELRDGEACRNLIVAECGIDGHTCYWSCHADPVFDTKDNLLGYRGIERDVSEQITLERILILERTATNLIDRDHDIATAMPELMSVLTSIIDAAEFSYWSCDAHEGAMHCVFAHKAKGDPSSAIGRQLLFDGPDPAQILLSKQLERDEDDFGDLFFALQSHDRVLGLAQLALGPLGSPAAAMIAAIEQVFGRLAVHFADCQVHSDAAREREEAKLRASEERFRALTKLSSDWYWETDEHYRCTRLESSRRNNDQTRERILGKCLWEAGYQMDGEDDIQSYRQMLEQHQAFRNVILVSEGNHGRWHYLSVSGEPVFNEAAQFVGYRGISHEITENRLAQERIRHIATHDSLTGLSNRVMFTELLNHTLEGAKRNHSSFAVLFIDLDRFKFINDALGHEAGDALLIELARRFKSCLRAEDVVARVGGDEFLVLLSDTSAVVNIQIATRKLLNAAMQSVMIGGQECRVTASIGIAVYPDNGTDEQSLMKAADAAMYQAKSEGKNNCQFFDAKVRANSLQRMNLETHLRMAMERRELSLHYQPKLDLKSGRITGVEALLRWDNPELGSVPPMQFIPIAEEIGLIVPIGKWVLRQALQQGVAWRQAGMPGVCMAVNLSVRQFSDPNLLSTVRETLHETGTPPHMLELEITESMLMRDIDHAIAVLSSLRSLGVRLALDDFGTGYSSLAQLRQFPINTLKVDRSFIREVASTEEDGAITEAIIAMGKVLSLTIIAEGVETEAQENFLRARACDEIQGYCFSKPLPADEFASFLAQKLSVPNS